MKILIAVLLIIHGLIVAGQSAGSFVSGTPIPNPAWLQWWPTGLGQSWLFSGLGLEATPVRALGGIVWLAGGLALVAAGLALLGVGFIPIGWHTLAVTGCILSLAMLSVYLHPFLAVGMGASLAVLYMVMWADATLLAKWGL